MSAVWTAWTSARHELYLKQKDEAVARHGADHFEERVGFYRAIDALFADGNLGGARISGRRPTEHELALSRGRQGLRAGQGLSRTASLHVVEGAAGLVQDSESADAVVSGAVGRGRSTDQTERMAVQLQVPYKAGARLLALQRLIGC